MQSIGRGVRELCSAKMLIIPGSVKSSFSSQRFHEELNKGRYPMLQCWKGNEELNKGRDFELQCGEGSVVAELSEGVADPW